MQKSHTECYCMAARVRGGWHSTSRRWSEIGARQLDFNFGLPGIVGVGNLLISKWKSCCKDMWEHVKLFISPAESCAFCCLLVAPAYFLQATLPLLISYWALLSGAWTENRVEKHKTTSNLSFLLLLRAAEAFFFFLFIHVFWEMPCRLWKEVRCLELFCDFWLQQVLNASARTCSSLQWFVPYILAEFWWSFGLSPLGLQ